MTQQLTAPHIVTINNNHRIFLVTGDMNQSFVCNIEDLETVYNWFADKDNIVIQHKWNGRFVKCSKKSIVDMLQALNLSSSFITGGLTTYKIKFKGCKLGAIGKPVTQFLTISAPTFKEAALKMYETHEHIFIISVNGKPYSYVDESTVPA